MLLFQNVLHVVNSLHMFMEITILSTQRLNSTLIRSIAINKISSLRQLDSLTKPSTDKISHVIPVFENCHVPNCVKESAHHIIVKTY